MMKKQTSVYVAATLMMIGMLCISNTQAGLDMETYDFYNITHNNAANAATGQLQLSVAVSDKGSGFVGFKFMNAGPADCVITEIYFQDGSILGFASIDESLSGVDFKEDEVGNVSPKNLPGGKSIDPQFIATTGFSIEPVNPEPTWGVEPGEWVEIVYSLQSGKTYANIIEELNTETLRIGIHVQSFENGGSESFITPEPATMVLLGLGGLLLRKRRKI
ncbi:MAG: PEP-CTERM sorting domain-containing protein [Planctomycetota bacterium]|jgi:hypothetical protein